MTREEFIQTFGSFKEKKQRYSWSGECIPKYFEWNKYGQTIVFNDNNDLLIVYNSTKDSIHTNIPQQLQNKNIVIAFWAKDKLSKCINNKFNQKGFVICNKNSDCIYTNISFGRNINFEIFVQLFKERLIFFDSGMYSGNSRNYSHFRATFDIWNHFVYK